MGIYKALYIIATNFKPNIKYLHLYLQYNIKAFLGFLSTRQLHRYTKIHIIIAVYNHKYTFVRYFSIKKSAFKATDYKGLSIHTKLLYMPLVLSKPL